MKVLVIRLSSLGDVVLATAAVEALAEDVPGVEIHVLTKLPFRDLFEHNPRVTRIHVWEAKIGVAAMARSLRVEGFNWVVDLHANLRTRLLRPLLAGPQWTVYAKGALRRRLSVMTHRPAWLTDRHVVDRYVAALVPLGARNRRQLPCIYLDKAEKTDALERLNARGWNGTPPLVALAPGARWPTKAWPAEHWVEVAQRVAQDGIGFPVLLGGSDEASLCGSILEKSGGSGVNLAGRTTVRETAAVLEVASVLVSNDSAPLHLATAVGTPVVALFGPTVRGFGFYPLGERDALLEMDRPCRPCSLHGTPRCPKGHFQCLRDLPAALVLEQVVQKVSLQRKNQTRC